MFRTMITTTALLAALATPAFAATFEVKMLNKGEAGTMVFEPGSLSIAPGDTVKFLATDKGHNAETIPKMLPEGAEPFKGKINQEVDVTFDVPGYYGIKCKPHFAMGMVMTIKVGEVDKPTEFLVGRIPPLAKKRLDAQLEAL